MQNAGFFLLVILFAFGFMGGAEHQALAGFFVSTLLTLLIPFSVWALYLLKIIYFNQVTILRIENQFLECTILFPGVKRVFVFALCIILQLMPAIFYGLFLCVIAIQTGKVTFVAFVLLLLALLVVAGVALLQHSFIAKKRELQSSFFKKLMDKRLARPYTIICVEALLRSETLSLFTTKLAGYFFLITGSYLYKTDIYDWRLMAFAAALAFSCNNGLVLALFKFENNMLMWTKNLPFSYSKRLLNTSLILLLFLVPEIIILFKNSPDVLEKIYILGIILLGLSMVICVYVLMFLPIASGENQIRLVFALTVSWIIMILSGTQLYFMIGINSAIAALIYRNCLYRYT